MKFCVQRKKLINSWLDYQQQLLPTGQSLENQPMKEAENSAPAASLNNEISRQEGKNVECPLQLRKKNQSLSAVIENQRITIKQLKQSTLDLQATLQAIPDLLFEFDEQATIIEVWTSDTILSQEQRSMMSGCKVQDVLSRQAALKVLAAINKAQQEGQSHGETILTAFQEQLYWFELSTSLKPHPDGTDRFLMLFHDVTEKKRMEKELFSLQKLESVGVLAGGIAHDFNNILTSILGRIELAAKSVGEQDQATERLLMEAKEATLRAAKLTQQLLTFAKGGDPVKETTSLTSLVKESANFILRGSHLSCDYHFAADLWLIDADSGQVGQVIQNIVINAKEAMTTGGRIEISGENVPQQSSTSIPGIEPGNYVRITISDDGQGIPPEIIENIFDPYYTTKEKGSGLGLSICHAIIKKHQGKIMVHSLSGQGTTFTIYLPAAVAQASQPVGAVAAAGGIEAKRILVMDDDEMLLELAQLQLSELGHQAYTVEDGSQALSLYVEMKEKNTPFDLVIMDLTIRGGMGGKEAVQKLLTIDKRATVVVVSGYSTDPVLAQFQDYGFCAALTKPFDLTMLQSCIEKVADHR